MSGKHRESSCSVTSDGRTIQYPYVIKITDVTCFLQVAREASHARLFGGSAQLHDPPSHFDRRGDRPSQLARERDPLFFSGCLHNGTELTLPSNGSSLTPRCRILFSPGWLGLLRMRLVISLGSFKSKQHLGFRPVRPSLTAYRVH